MYYIDDSFLYHEGVSKRDGAEIGSGRYPLGSGENPYQHALSFLSKYDKLKMDGKTDSQIASEFGYFNYKNQPSPSILKNQLTIMKNYQKLETIGRAKQMFDSGMNYVQIGKALGKPESTIRNYIKTDIEERKLKSIKVADFLRDKVDQGKMIDVSAGTQYYIDLGDTATKSNGVSEGTLAVAVQALKNEGYSVIGGRQDQVNNPGKKTTIKVLAPPGTPDSAIYGDNVINIESLVKRKKINTEKSFKYPSSMDSKRLEIRYAEDGGENKDGLIEIRRGVKDLSLGDAHYAQVRILVDGTHYLKGMAVYSDDLPEGKDIIFNTNKNKGTPALGPDKKNTVLKLIGKDPDNPFNSLIKEDGGQSYYIDKDGKEKLSLINKRADEGDWNKWDKTIASQFLAKQPQSTINKQLDITKKNKQEEFDKICSLTNPTLKRKMLMDFSEDCDASSEELKATAFTGQRWGVIIPVPSLKNNEIYAPQYKNGTELALVRYPHAGIFEIPKVTVNNNNKEASKMIPKTSIDAVGINASVASILSGADFDGDTVMMIPTIVDGKKKTNIQNKSPLSGLIGFDPKKEYPKVDGMRYMTNTNNEMGKISNLITDMTIKGASDKELAMAVRHSMVVIDAEKHSLNYKQSEIDNHIKELKKKYQPKDDPDKPGGGASTLLTRAKSEYSVPEYRIGGYIKDPITGVMRKTTIDPKTGEVLKTETGRTYYKVTIPGEKKEFNAYVTKTGAVMYKPNKREKYIEAPVGAIVKEKKAITKSTQMAETKNAESLISEYNSPQERAYANYANFCKQLANKARLEYLNTPPLKYNASANKTYASEVEHLEAEVRLAERNAPREREAQRIANYRLNVKKDANPDMTKKEEQKIGQQELTKARIEVGAKRHEIDLSDKEWEAIQAGAISDNKLQKILQYSNQEDVVKRALPSKGSKTLFSSAQIARIKALAANGKASISDIAASFGVSTSTIYSVLNN